VKHTQVQTILALVRLSVTLLVACPLGALGLGFRIPNQDAEATGRGNAFVATADNPSAIYYNPAGITQLEGQNAQFGMHASSVNSEYEAPNGRHSKTIFEIQPVPQFYYTYSWPKKPWSFGLGMYAPYGLGLEWPDTTGFRTLALEGRLLYATINPVAAWRIHERLSLAAGPTFNYGRVMLRQGIATPADEFKFKGDDQDWGFNCGLLWRPHDKWSLGANYRSATTMNFNGKSEAWPYTPRESTSARIPFGQFAAVGVSFRPSPRWNVEFNVDWTDWDRLNTVTFKRSSGDIAFPMNWQSSFLYEAGISRSFSHGYFASLGYFFSGNSTTTGNFTPLVPDTDLHVASVGMGRKGQRWNWALTYQMITGPWRTVSNSQSTSLAGESADGKYHFFNHALNFSLGYHF